MTAATHLLDLGGMRLSAGEGRRLDLMVKIDPLTLGGEPYAARPEVVPVRLDVSRMTGSGYALRLRFVATLTGACMRCLKDAAPQIEVDAREVDVPGGGEELSSPYVTDEELDLAGWTRDAFALALPTQVLCRDDCAGLCPVCATDLNEVGPNHAHERSPDPRWAKLSELKLE
ncbi:MAG: YceD family protein [Solirubrobacteraceae bacterium]